MILVHIIYLQILKWNFIELRAEFVDQLQLQMEKNFNKTIMEQLFHSDFKCHIKAIEGLTKVRQCRL
jgi:cytoskeleton-associated protein 5